MPDPSRDHSGGGGSVHQPVLLREVLRFLDLQPGLSVADGTVGAGGHSTHILKHITSTGTLIGLDRDAMMLTHAAKRLDAESCHLHQASYTELEDILEQLGIASVDRVLLDLGLSSDQLADDTRGFGFQTPGPLDLRFDTRGGSPAWEQIQDWDVDTLEGILKEYGEERFARRIAENIKTANVRTVDDVCRAVESAVPGKQLREARKHPATRVFQALRIAVNNELDHVKTMVGEVLPRCLSPGGIAVVISFHSLEDRIIKAAFRGESWQILTPKPVTAQPMEQRLNPRARSAKLRAAKKP